MLYFRVLARHFLSGSLGSLSNSLKIRTYEPPLPYPLYNHYLQGPFATVHSRPLITPAKSTLTQSPASNSLILRTYRKHGGGEIRPSSLLDCFSASSTPVQPLPS